MKIALISSTNRPNSQTRKLTKFIESLMKPLLKSHESLHLVDLVELPSELFSPMSYAEKPKSFEPFTKVMTECQAMFFVIPEYNGGAPGALKFFIDMLPFPQSLSRRPAAFVGLGAGRFGNLRGVEQIEDILRYRNAYLFGERTFIAGVDKALDETGAPKDEQTLKVLKSEVSGFLEFARRLVQ